MTSLVQNIPDEILEEIFIRCLFDEPWEIALSPKEAPLLLTHVCRHWRQVAIGFNRLWLWLKLQPHSVRVTHVEEFRPLTEVLGRAHGGSLNLQIGVPDFKASIPPILSSLIVPFSRSLTRLTILSAPLPQLVRLPPSLFLHLERLALDIHYPDTTRFSPDYESASIRAFEDAPALRYVVLATKMVFDRLPVSLPFPQLTHLMNTGNRGTFRDFLRQGLPECKELRWLAFSLTKEDFFMTSLWAAISPRSMENIESLSLDFWSSGSNKVEYPDFFSKTHFPNLKALRLESSELAYENSPRAWPIHLLTSFLDKLEHEFIQLEYLSLCHGYVSRSSLNITFRATPRLTTLDLQIYEGLDTVFKVLTLGPDTHLLPLLQTLVLEIGSSLPWEEETGEIIDPLTFGPFLESRLRPGAATRTLQKIIVYATEHKQVSEERPFIKTIQSYVSQGLLELERLGVERRQRTKYKNLFWMERDPWLSDWSSEVSLII